MEQVRMQMRASRSQGDKRKGEGHTSLSELACGVLRMRMVTENKAQLPTGNSWSALTPFKPRFLESPGLQSEA